MKYSPIQIVRIPSLTFTDFSHNLISNENDWEKAFSSRIEKLLELSKVEEFQESLLFSSHVFLDQLPRLHKLPSIEYKKKERQILLRLHEYVNRMRFRASPLSHFAKVQLRDEKWNLVHPVSDSYARINKKIWHLLESQIDQIVPEHSQLLIKVNPFLEPQAKSLHFLQFWDDHKLFFVKAELTSLFTKLLDKIGKENLSIKDLYEFVNYTLGLAHYQTVDLIKELISKQILMIDWPNESPDLLGELMSQFTDQQVEFFVKHFHNPILWNKDWRKEQDNATQVIKNKELNISKETIYYQSAFSDEGIREPDDKELITENALELYTLVQSCQIKEENQIKDGSLLSAFEMWDEIDPVFQLNKSSFSKIENKIVLDLDVQESGQFPEMIGLMLREIGAEKPLLVNWTPGFGKYYHSYLDHFPLKQQEAYAEWVRTNQHVVQNNDHSPHPGNINSFALPLLYSFGLKDAKSVVLKGPIIIKEGKLYDAGKEKYIHLIDMGVQNPESRSSLFRFLNTFCKVKSNFLDWMHAVKSAHLIRGEEFIYSPQIESAHMILSLPEWHYFNSKAFLDPNLDEYEFYRAVQNKKDELKLSPIIQYRFQDELPRFLELSDPLGVKYFQRRLLKSEGELILNCYSYHPVGCYEYYFEAKRD